MLRRQCFPLALAPLALAQSESRLLRIRSYIDAQVKDGPFPGIYAALQYRGQLAFSHSAGFSDLEAGTPMSDDTIFRMHSMTKAIACAALMSLYEEGKFLLDEPVAKYIPGFENTKVLSVESDPESKTVDLKRPITIHHLATHTSGLNNQKAYGQSKIFAGTLGEMAAKLPAVPLSHQPGEAWRYGQSIDAIGRLVEVISGVSFDRFLAERFFAPLQMRDTGFFVPTAKVKRLAVTYTLNDGNRLVRQALPEPDRKPTYFSGGGGLYGTAVDFLRFYQMLANGGSLDGAQILSRATVDFMFRNHVPAHLFPAGGPNGRVGYGFGIGGAVLRDAAEAETLSIDGEYTWGGAAGTYFWIDRKTQLVGIWCVQRPPFTQPPSKRFKVLAYQALT